MLVEVLLVFGQDGDRVTLIDDEDPVQQFAPEAADRSAMAFARGAWTGVVRMCTPEAVKMVSKTRLNWVCCIG
jgi:hypothetical protein